MPGTAAQVATGDTNSPYISANGTKVAFVSRNPTVPRSLDGQSTPNSEVYVEDLATGALTLVSAGANGPANYDCYYPTLSADGTKVAFVTSATNLVAGGTSGTSNVYVADVATGTLTLVSSGPYGLGNGDSSWPILSGDGTKIVFTSNASNLVPGDTNGTSDVFVEDLATKTVTRVSTNGTVQADGPSYLPSISADGSKVAFMSSSNTLATFVTGGASELYVKDLGTGSLKLVSDPASGLFGSLVPEHPSLSADGTKVAFVAEYGNYPYEGQDYYTKLVGGAHVGSITGVYVADLATGAITFASGGQGFGPTMSADGTKVAFMSYDALTPDDTNADLDIYVRNLATGALTLASNGGSRLSNNLYSTWDVAPTVSADGSKVAFWGTVPSRSGYDGFSYVTSFAPPNRAPTALVLSGASVAEHVAAGTVVGTFSAAAPDAGDTASFSLVAGAGSTDDAAFEISGGQLKLRVSPDYAVQQSYSIRVRATDSGGLSYEQAFTISVIDVNDPPTISGGGSAPVQDNATAKPFANAASSIVIGDPDLGQTETATVTYAAANGVLYDPNAASDGSSSAAGAYTVSGSAAQVQAALRGLLFAPTGNQVAVGQQVATTFTLSVSDGAYTTTDSSAVLVATSVNDAPLALALSGGVGEDDGPLLLGPGWADPDPGDAHAFSLDLAGTKGAARIDPATGAISYSPAGAFDWLPAGWTAADTFGYTVTDASGASARATVTVTITGANDPATISGTAVGTVAAESATAQTTSGTLAVSDVDLGEAVFQRPASQALAGTYGTFLFDQGGAWSYALDGARPAVLALAAAETATDTLAVVSRDGTASKAVVVTVVGANRPPVVLANSTTAAGSVAERAGAAGSGTPDTASGAIAFTDTNLKDTHAVSSSLTGASWSGGSVPGTLRDALARAFGATLAADSTGGAVGKATWTFALPDASLDFLAQGEVLTATYGVAVSDGRGGAVAQPVTVTVTGTNDAPTLRPAATQAGGAVAERPATVGSTAVDQAGGAVAFADLDLTDVHTAAVRPQAAAGYLGAFALGPVTDSTGTGSGSVGWTFQVADRDLDALAAGQQIVQRYDIAVDDGHGGSVVQTVAVTLTGANDAPTITGAQAAQTVADNAAAKPFGAVQVGDPDAGARDSVSITVTGSDGKATDANGLLSGAGLTKTGKGTYQLAAAAPGALTAALDALVFTPTANQVAVGQAVTTGFVLTATDDQGATAANAVTTVSARSVNDAPTLAKPTLSYTVTEGQTVQNLYRDILANVRDADPGDAAQATVAAIGAPGGGAAFLDPVRKTLTYTAGGFNAKQPTDQFTYTVSDGHGGTATGTVALTVTGASLPTQVGTAAADVLVASAANTRLVGVGGNDLLVANAAGTLVYAGDGDDMVVVGAAKAVVHGGAGTNTVLFGAAQDMAVLQQGSRDEIYGFNLYNGSQLDVSQVLAEAQVALSDIRQVAAYFGVAAAGADASLLFNPNGTGTAAPGSSVLAVLHGIGAGTSLATLLAHDAIKV